MNIIDNCRYLIEAGADVNQKDGVSIRIPYQPCVKISFVFQLYCITCEYNHSIILC